MTDGANYTALLIRAWSTTGAVDAAIATEPDPQPFVVLASVELGQDLSIAHAVMWRRISDQRLGLLWGGDGGVSAAIVGYLPPEILARYLRQQPITLGRRLLLGALNACELTDDASVLLCAS